MNSGHASPLLFEITSADHGKEADVGVGVNDVRCARGKSSYNHSGNKRFRQLLQSHVEEYERAQSRLEKSIIVSAVVRQIQDTSPLGRFVRRKDNAWVEVGEGAAREKVGQGFRDLLDTKYKSATKAKQRQRSKTTNKTPKEAGDLLTSCTGQSVQASLPKQDMHLSDVCSSDDESQIEQLFQDANKKLLDKIKKESAETLQAEVSSLLPRNEPSLYQPSTSEK